MEEHPNKQDKDGNTKLHHAVVAWQEHNAATQAQKDAYESLNIQRKTVLSKLKASQNPQERTDLQQQCQQIEQKAKRVQKEFHTATKTRSAVYEEVAQLLEQGYVINLANNKGKTAEQLCPKMFELLVYNPLKHALKQEDIARATKLLELGANPNFMVNNQCALLNTLEQKKLASVALLCAYGASISYELGENTSNIFHAIGVSKNKHHAEAAVVMPYGTFNPKANAPSRLHQCHLKFYSLLCCLQHLEIKIPAEIKSALFGLLLPEPKELINLVSLQKLKRYTNYVSKNNLCMALTDRHIFRVQKLLEAKLLNRLNASECARFGNPDLAHVLGVIVLSPPNECSTFLDPKQHEVEKRRDIIYKNYKELL